MRFSMSFDLDLAAVRIGRAVVDRQRKDRAAARVADEQHAVGAERQGAGRFQIRRAFDETGGQRRRRARPPGPTPRSRRQWRQRGARGDDRDAGDDSSETDMDPPGRSIGASSGSRRAEHRDVRARGESNTSGTVRVGEGRGASTRDDTEWVDGGRFGPVRLARTVDVAMSDRSRAWPRWLIALCLVGARRAHEPHRGRPGLPAFDDRRPAGRMGRARR